MVTIDETIAYEREKAKEQRSHIGTWDEEYSQKCEEWAKEHEQLAERLEELKAIKSDGFTDDLLNMGFTKGYNKALDDFAEKLKAKEEELFEPDCGGMYDSSYERSFNNGILAMDEAIDEIAEQLKAGGKE